ncbi:MAG TPA: hypothetical protein VFW73_02385 [Lacipirellulaceae bacterium]|nr:hypothetical protein [Lacipirellulaceae bacterium]
MTIHSQRSTSSVIERASFPPIAFGLSSVILGAIGLALFIMPVIGIPIGVAGAAIGLLGMIVVYFGGTASVRLCMAGLVLSGCAVGVNWAISGAAGGYFRPRQVFPLLPPAIERPYVPPPAEPQFALNYKSLMRVPLT